MSALRLLPSVLCLLALTACGTPTRKLPPVDYAPNQHPTPQAAP